MTVRRVSARSPANIAPAGNAPAGPPVDAWRLPFERQEMVCWFHPIEIGRTAMRVLFADAVTSFVDIRESQAALSPIHIPNRASLQPPLADPDDPLLLRFERAHNQFANGKSGIWIDMVSDLGDGWQATYAVAEMVGRERLELRGLEDALPRAQLMVFGGDCVYPTPGNKEYRDRLEGPYDAAFSQRKDPATPAPSLLAIPGNHDWYDGLISFLRVFCHGGRIGGWQTRQSRSYFAVKLPMNWSLWGIDIQLDTPIDRPQLDYFAHVAETLKKENQTGVKPRVIICTALPAWLGNERGAYEKSFRNYWHFIRHAVTHGCDPCVTLTGDLHHYARYASATERQLITVGGGGSYLSATHDLPTMVRLPENTVEPVRGSEAYSRWREQVGEQFTDSGFPFPRRSDSRRIALRTLAFPFLSRNWTVCVVIGLVYAWFPWMLRWTAGSDFPSSQLSQLLYDLDSRPFTWAGFASVWRFYVDAFLRYPSTWLPAGVLIVAFAMLCPVSEPAKPRWIRWIWGGLHGVCHVLLAGTIAWFLAHIGSPWSGDPVHLRWQFLLWFLGMMAAGGLAGGLLMGVYFVMSDLILGWHTNEVFAAQSNPDYRSFIRMLVGDDGSLTIYPIALRRVPRHWRARIGARPWESRYESRDIVPGPELIEGPIVINPTPLPV